MTKILRCLGGFFASLHSQLCKKEQSYRVKHVKFEFANGRSHINEIVNFWGPYKG
ncbi:hypothetical protein [Campylobacter troglodytis]|uniref:hypothetical protein n=1 Tax=Campylobacter troglodytis TaxID=654363 RepID=UPI00163CA401|nr:hypothetical protein [Campylobacter troglodytis]